ncbi:hypothetical protein CMQ_3226 [Grosmannia clavigera kw1407]|uniref:Basic proline-rich protein n=1 Tax=Grosmannia clavigera (strain kw1407 / UAMH 11150) TaxID=655863 RepID=F0XHE5_GROCL|nr:uncharacterized protein CMQ_3226 [Grosmannia clavigera kw1407]EFX03297.1 hypothetical protein CMQ_3226 [Grosmannia clavigera kw1407]
MRLQNSSTFSLASPAPLSPRSAADSEDYLRKPSALRQSAEPLSPVSPSWAASPGLPYRPRTTSPLSGHIRSRSAASVGSLFPPAMGRTQSMPGFNGAGHLQYGLDPRMSSPSLHRPTSIITRTPRKAVIEDVFPSSPTRMSVIHDPDRRLLERNSSPNLTSPGSASPLAIAGSPLMRTRRPSSPFRRISNPSATPTSPGAAATASSDAYGNASAITGPPSPAAYSPSYRPYDYPVSGSSYGSLGGFSSSSVPSTPTSARSRSPSISSLETIPDTPDAEEAALEAERIAQLKAAADAAEGDAKGRSSLDSPSRGRTLAFGSRDKRKRWSVCGAERRGDLDLETIWED